MDWVKGVQCAIDYMETHLMEEMRPEGFISDDRQCLAADAVNFWIVRQSASTGSYP